MADSTVFILPVVIDDTDGAKASVPDKFKAVHFTRLPGGEDHPRVRAPDARLPALRHAMSRGPIFAGGGAA